MIVIYPDTNALFQDPRMRSKMSSDLIAMLKPGEIELWISPVVVAEIERQLREAASGAVENVRKAFRSLRPKFDDVDGELLGKILEPLEVQGKQALTPLLSNPACKVLDWSKVSAQELVHRELERRKPTLLKDNQSVGLRDTVIWHDLLEMLPKLTMTDEVIFVTRDKGYLEGDSLDASLATEIDQRGQKYGGPVTPFPNLDVMPSLNHVVEVLSSHSPRQKAIRLALLEMVEHLDEELWRKGDVSVRSAHLPRGFNAPTLEAVSGVEIVKIGTGQPAACIAQANLVFHGIVPAFDYFELEEAWNIKTLGVRPGGNEFAVQFLTTATVYADIDYEASAQKASVIQGRVVWTDEEHRLFKLEELEWEARLDAAAEAFDEE